MTIDDKQNGSLSVRLYQVHGADIKNHSALAASGGEAD